MVRNKKVTGTSKSIPVGICTGTGAALAATFAGSLFTAWLISFEKIGENAIGYCAIVILMLSSMLGGYLAQATVKHQRLVMCTATGAAYYLSLLAITALFFGGQYQGMGVTALVVAAGVGVMILMGLKRSASHNSKLKNYGYG